MIRSGPLLLGNLFGYGLFGVLCVQVFIYSNRYQQDPLWVKSLVASIFCIEALMIILATKAAWDILGSGWGNISVLTSSDWPFAGLAFLSGLVSFIIHTFFCWRIWKLRPAYKWLILVIIIISIVQWIMATICGARGLQSGTATFDQVAPFIIVWLGGLSLCNVLITIAMIRILSQSSFVSTLDGTTTLSIKFIRLTAEAGIMTSIGALIELLLFAIFSDNNMHFLVFFMLSKIYSNTLLVILNSRSPLEDTVAQTDHVSTTIWDKHPPTGTIYETYGSDSEMATPWDEPFRRKSIPYVSLPPTGLRRDRSRNVPSPVPPVPPLPPLHSRPLPRRPEVSSSSYPLPIAGAI